MYFGHTSQFLRYKSAFSCNFCKKCWNQYYQAYVSNFLDLTPIKSLCTKSSKYAELRNMVEPCEKLFHVWLHSTPSVTSLLVPCYPVFSFSLPAFKRRKEFNPLHRKQQLQAFLADQRPIKISQIKFLILLEF